MNYCSRFISSLTECIIAPLKIYSINTTVTMILSSHVKQYHSSDQNMAPISPRGRAQVLTKQGITGSQAPASLTSPLARLLSHPPTPPAGLRAVPGPHQVHSPLTLCLPAASFPAPLSPQNICRIYLLTFFGPLLNSVRTSLTTPIKDTQSEGAPCIIHLHLDSGIV